MHAGMPLSRTKLSSKKKKNSLLVKAAETLNKNNQRCYLCIKMNFYTKIFVLSIIYTHLNQILFDSNFRIDVLAIVQLLVYKKKVIAIVQSI